MKTSTRKIPPDPRPRRRLLLVALLVAGTTLAGNRFEVVEATVDGGGEHSQGTRFTVEGTIGQPDTATLHGTRFTIDGGFWRPATDALFHNGFED